MTPQVRDHGPPDRGKPPGDRRPRPGRLQQPGQEEDGRRVHGPAPVQEVEPDVAVGEHDEAFGLQGGIRRRGDGHVREPRLERLPVRRVGVVRVVGGGSGSCGGSGSGRSDIAATIPVP